MQIAILLYPGFTALDLIGPYETLRWLPDTEVRFVWHTTGPVPADSGVLLIGATHTLEETPSPDVVLVPGGFTTASHARDRVVQRWVRDAHATATWTTSVCSGSLVLAAAGMLEGRRATSHWAVLQGLRAFGATPVADERIVQAGDGIVTAAGVSAGIDLGLWLAGEIAGQDRAEAIQLSLEYDPQPPFDAGHMSTASAATRRDAAALMAREAARPAQVVAAGGLLWDAAIGRARRRRRARR